MLLSFSANIIIATPGRLEALFEENKSLRLAAHVKALVSYLFFEFKKKTTSRLLIVNKTRRDFFI